MNKVVKRIAILMMSILLVVGLFGCSNNTSGKADSKGKKPKEIKLTYQYWDLIPEQEKLFAKFSEEYKKKTGINVTIDGQYISDAGWEDTLKTQVAAGGGPDVFHLDLGLASSWRDAVIQPLSPYYKKDFWNQFIPSTIKVWKFDNNYYAVPNSFSVVDFLYNKEMLKNAGVNVDSSTRWTLADFESAMQKIHDTYKGKTVKYEDGKEYPYYTVGSASLMYWWWLFWSYGGESLNKTNNIAQKEYVDAIMKIADYADKGWVTNAADVLPGKVTIAFSSAANVALYPTGDWTPTTFYRKDKGIGEARVPQKVDYGSLVVPLGDDGKPHAEMYNQGVVMNKNLDGWKADAAANFIKYMTTTDAWMGARGPEVGGLGIPARKEWAEKYAKSWFEKPEERDAFVWTANNGVITSSDYHVSGVDMYTPVQDALTLAYNEAAKPGALDMEAVRKQVIAKLEEGQKSLNTQLQENDIKLDNPKAAVK
ncbi:extracellular solute-binding protein [Neobacillus sp. PS3-34]|uniref:ABC transporter substrate-binding protein n=1 Tax=Neobacillus sp. PS3-34 TaxID=3070678 RepID=UPI0027DEE85F|nr:extracellular solute-binding protein [Neobacillus sp. PS3-34]WML48311.1 extracellular solute-binding protein [Neobacillus sp. PS3-34]